MALVIFGLKLGIDFKGGTLLDITFEKQVTTDEIKAELKNMQDSLNSSASSSKSTPAAELLLKAAKNA